MVAKSEIEKNIQDYVQSFSNDKSVFKSSGIMLMSDKPKNVPTISTGSMVLDNALGGGIPVGRVIEIFGPESSGKTTFALTSIAEVHKNGGYAGFIDMEYALDPSYAAKLGVDMDKLVYAQPSYAEKAIDLMCQLAEDGMLKLVVLDSIAAMVPLAELEGGAEDITVGLLARKLSAGLRKLIGLASQTGTTFILINQTRDQIGGFSPYGTPQTTPGGKATKFYASQRIEIKRSKIEERSGNNESAASASKLTFEVKKNKIAPPGAKGSTVIRFGSGLDRVAELLTVGDKFGVIQRPNNRTYIDAETGEIIGKSRAEAETFLSENPDVIDRMMRTARENMKEGGFDSQNLEVDLNDDIDEDLDAGEETETVSIKAPESKK